MTSWVRTCLRTAALLPVFLGLLVLFGWWTHNAAIIQVHPTFVGMRFNTALCFVFAGAALALADLDRPKAARALGALLLLFGALSFSQDLTGHALGIDEFFIRDYLPMGTNAPGRMAPSTSICFICFGGACLAERTSRHAWASWVQSLGAAVLVAMGGLSVVGYLSGVATFLDWGRFAYMAIHTALGMLLLGVGIFLHAWLRRGGDDQASWLPLPFGLMVLVATLVIWRALVNQERHVMEGILVQEANILIHELKDDFEDRRRALSRMAARWEHAARTPSQFEWEEDARLYVAHERGYRALEWVDSNYRVRWVMPPEDNERVKGADFSKDVIRRTPYEQALAAGHSTSGPDMDLLQGGWGFTHCVPVRREDRPDGFITAVFEIQKWMGAVWSRPGHVTVEVWSHDRRLFSNGAVSKADVDQGATVDLPFEGRIWQMRVHPTQILRNQVRTLVPTVVLLAGSAFAVLVAFLVRALQGARAGTRQLREVNLRLSEEARERQKAEQALREADLSRSLILENATVGIGLVVDRRFTWVNHRVAEMVGLSYDAVQGAPTRVIYPDDETWEFVGREGYAVLAKGSIFEAELRLRRVGGEPFWCRFVGRALDATRVQAGSIWMFEDIDARVRSERMQRQFLSTVSHELRTPLTAIKGSMALLKSGLGGHLDAKGEDLLGIALSNCDRLVRLVNEILDLEKLRAGALEFQMQREDLRRVAREAAEGNLGMATQAGVLLAHEPIETPAWAKVDAHRLRQVIDNLLSNAVKFSAPGSRVDLKLEPGSQGWTFRVEDEGRGIPESFLPRLFEPFTQADGTDAREKGGTGLGLSITKALVEGMGGQIRVESTLGKGTCFYVDLPGET